MAFIITYFKPSDIYDGKPINENTWFTAFFIVVYFLIWDKDPCGKDLLFYTTFTSLLYQFYFKQSKSDLKVV